MRYGCFRFVALLRDRPRIEVRQRAKRRGAGGSHTCPLDSPVKLSFTRKESRRRGSARLPVALTLACHKDRSGLDRPNPIQAASSFVSVWRVMRIDRVVRIRCVVRVRRMVRIARIMWVVRIRRVVRVRRMMRIARIMRIMGRMVRVGRMLFLPDPCPDAGCLESVEPRLVLAHVRRIRAPVEALLDRTRVRVLPALHCRCRSRQSNCRHRTSSQEDRG